MFFQQSEPPKTPLVSIVIESFKEEPEVVAPVEVLYTLEDKIKDNVNGCSPTRIRADNAECLPEPVYTPPKIVNTPQTTVRSSSSASRGWYPIGQCTEHIYNNRSVGQWNNASEWLWQAKRDGWATGSTPRVGAIAWEPGHVSLVIAVNGTTITVSEKNYVGWNVVSTRTAPASQFQYIY